MSEQETVDPVLRCDSCQAIVRTKETVNKIGCCYNCGNRRFRSIALLRPEECQQITDWGYGDFLKKFPEVVK